MNAHVIREATQTLDEANNTPRHGPRAKKCTGRSGPVVQAGPNGLKIISDKKSLDEFRVLICKEPQVARTH